MDNKIIEEVDKINIPKELSERSKMGIAMAKKEQFKRKSNRKRNIVILTAILLIILGANEYFNNGNLSNDTANDPPTPTVSDDGSVEIPAMELPDNADMANADMIGLIVYNGKIYTQSDTKISYEAASKLLGEKLGKTKGNIDEWSSQDEYAQEFASTIGKTDVYTVQGYDPNFRIMAYGNPYVEFYDNLNGITVSSGEDIFGKLHLTGNVTEAKFRFLSDWDYAMEEFHNVENKEILEAFVDKLSDTTPILRSENSDPIANRTEENFRELILTLEDGSEVSLKLLKDRYIYYGFSPVYFQMENQAFEDMWTLLQ